MKGGLNVDLLRVFRKRKIFLLEESEKIVNGTNVEDEKLLIEILRINTKDFTEEEKERMREIKEKAANILEKFFNEKSVSAILNSEISVQKREEVAKKYLELLGNGQGNKVILKKIAESPFSQQVKDSALEKLLESGDVMELITAFQHGGKEIQERALKKALESKLPTEDICWLIMVAKPKISEKIFEEKIKKTGMITKLTEEDLDKIKLSDSKKLANWARKRLIRILELKKKKLIKERRKILSRKNKVKTLEENILPHSFVEERLSRISWEIEEIEGKIKKINEE